MTGQSLVQAMKECGASTLLYGDECRKQAEDILRGFHPHQQQITDNKSSSSSSTASSSSSTTTNTNDVVISIGSLKASASSSPSQLRLFRVPDARFASSSPKNDNFNLSKASTLPPLLPTAHCLAYLLPESSDSLSLSSSSSSSSSTSASRPLSSSLPPSPIYRSHCHPHSPLFYIFTSGTTGLPKAAKVTHCRVFLAGITFSIMNGVNSSDIIYCPLPLYHSAAGLLGLGMSWCVGCSILIKRKFSASSFFRDCYEVIFGCLCLIYCGIGVVYSIFIYRITLLYSSTSILTRISVMRIVLYPFLFHLEQCDYYSVHWPALSIPSLYPTFTL